MYTRTLLPLMQREWLQHRFGWALLALIPLGLVFLMALFGDIQFDDDDLARPERLNLLLAIVPVVAATVVMLVIALATGFITVSGLARRDHADRSIEYWLSMPVRHSAALGVPLLVHLVLMPAAALLVGLLAGQLLSVLLVSRIAGFAALAEVPWGTTLLTTATFMLRLLAGLPLAVAWLLPIVLLLVLLNAWFKRWGWVVLMVGVGLLGLLDQFTAGQRWLLKATGEMARRAVQSLIGASGSRFNPPEGSDVLEMLLGVPAMAARDFAAALAALGSPVFGGGLLLTAACFALLLRWRQSGAGRAD